MGHSGKSRRQLTTTVSGQPCLMDQIPCETCGWDADTRSSPVQLKTPTHILLQWVRDNTLAALTILGILVYVIFSVPTTYFYARLGTTPSEVGVTYATIVSGSTFGLLLIAGLLAIALYYLFISLYDQFQQKKGNNQ